jgi:hypothetical protein
VAYVDYPPGTEDGTSGAGPLLCSGFILLVGFREKDHWPAYAS